MKIEMIIEKVLLNEIIETLKSIGMYSLTTIGNVKLFINELFPSNDKVSLLTICNAPQKKLMVERIFPLIHKNGGICVAFNHD